MAREKVWIVRPTDGHTVAEIVSRAGGTMRAIVDGRVFVGNKRVTMPNTRVVPGDRVRIGVADPLRPEVEVLFDRDDVVACIKPAGIASVPDHAGAVDSLVAVVARAVGVAPDTLRVTSRLDRGVSGVVLFAKTAEAEARLRGARERGTYARRYVALAQVTDPAFASDGVWTAPIETKASATRWRCVETVREFALLAVDPVSGRTHQIRIHASQAGAPLVGDREYGGPERLVLGRGRIVSPSRIGLHAARVSVDGIEAAAPIPPELRELWRALGGSHEAWDRALACDTPAAP